MIWQISIALIAVAFVVLVIFLIKTLRAAEKSLHTTAQTLQDVQKTIDELSVEVKQVVRQANEITSDLQHKMDQVDPVLESVKNVGDVLNEVTLAAKQVSSSLIGRIKNSPRSPKVTTNAPGAPVGISSPVPKSHNASNESASDAHKQRGWVKWVDIAATVWQKYRT
ncbi:hypothetical protein D3C74_124730 [compost metagenome]